MLVEKTEGLAADQKRCRKCGKNKKIFDFHKGRAKCKECFNRVRKERYWKDPEIFRKKTREWHKNHPETWRKTNIRNSASNAGLPREGIFEMLESHSGLCDICGMKDKSGRRLCIDHNHSTIKFRGFLCLRCNNGLGCFNDNISLLKKAIKYLKEK